MNERPDTQLSQRLRRYWDEHSSSYDREMAFLERVLFADGRAWVCSQATGDVLEVAIGTGRKFAVLSTGGSAHRRGVEVILNLWDVYRLKFWRITAKPNNAGSLVSSSPVPEAIGLRRAPAVASVHV